MQGTPEVVQFNDTHDRMWRALVCAVLEPGLRSVLLMDVLPADVLTIAEQLAKTTGRPAPLMLSFSETEERLFGDIAIEAGAGLLRWKPGRLVTPEPLVVAVPDLARTSLSAVRAMVSLMGSDVGHIERRGASLRWAPDCFWLAGIDRKAIGEVSPHLLDRFALRLAPGQNAFDGPLPDFVHNLALSQPAAAIPDSLRARIFTVLGDAEGFRRFLALARMTRACARFAGRAEAQMEDLDEAMRLMNIKPPAPAAPATSETAAPQNAAVPAKRNPPARRSPRQNVPQRTPAASSAAPAEPPGSAAAEPDQERALNAETVDVPAYPEDTAPVMRPPESLKLPAPRAAGSRAGEGIIVGTQPASSLRDIAWIDTILHAARFRRIRNAKGDRLPIRRVDLRSYRRAPVPQRLCTLLLDATAISGARWEDAILPYLRWAYVERAVVQVIQVGQANAIGNSELRARLISGRNVLSPSITRALEPSPGNATPLAHGLDLALRTIRNALHHGRARLDQVVFVLVTDGRGNVPLESSLRGEFTDDGNTGRRGVDDALQVAREIATLHNLRSFVIQPPLRVLRELPQQLAGALQAELIEMAPKEVART